MYKKIKIFIFFNYISLYAKKKNKSNDTSYYQVKIANKNNLNNFLKKNIYFIEKGLCSYYHNYFQGRKTSTGDVFSNKKWTCAHKTLPIPSVILVTFIYEKKIYGVKLLVNDRGPYVKKRILDVSQEVAKNMNFLHKGITNVIIFLLPKESLLVLKTGIFIPIKSILTFKEINEHLLQNNITLTKK